MKKLFGSLILFAFALHTSCCIPFRELWYAEGQWVKKIDTNELVHVVQQYVAYLKYVKHLRLEDCKVYYIDSVNTIHMEFLSQDLLEVGEARMLMVDLVEGLLAALNQDPILGPQFITYPLTPRQLEIFVDFESFDGIYDDPYYVGWMEMEQETATYYAFNLKYTGWDYGSQLYGGLDYWNYRTEPYTKSREIVIHEREGENMFKQVFETEQNTPNPLTKEQYRPIHKCRPRYYSPYDCVPTFK